MAIWTADEHVDAVRARNLIEARFADIAATDVELVSEGWDYVVFRVDREWAFRFPRRAVVAGGTELEMRVLPALAERLPVGLPVPTFCATPGDDFPWPFYGAPYLPGVEATGLDVDPAALAHALRALHEPATLNSVGDALPADPLHRVDMSMRIPRVREQLAKAGIDGDGLLTLAERLPPPRHTAVCHGDLHMRQILVDDGRLTGIVDWVDVCRSDPAVDLSVAWSALGPSARRSFFAVYGAVDEEREIRARVVAASLCAMLLDWALAENVPKVERAARAGAARAVER